MVPTDLLGTKGVQAHDSETGTWLRSISILSLGMDVCKPVYTDEEERELQLGRLNHVCFPSCVLISAEEFYVIMVPPQSASDILKLVRFY